MFATSLCVCHLSPLIYPPPLLRQVHGFFKGMTLPLTTITLTSSVVFGTYRNCLQCLSQARGACSGPSGKLDVFLSGMAAGVAQVTDASLFSSRQCRVSFRPRQTSP